MSTIKEILEETEQQGFRDLLATELWLAFLIDKDRLFIFQNPSFELDKKVEHDYWEGISEMAEGKPLAQLTGQKEFYGLSFFVDNKVLIPRPESEQLVELALQFVSQKGWKEKEVKVADIGTGSGVILLAVLKNLPSSRGIGTDLSADALKVAAENARKMGLGGRLRLLAGDLAEPLDEPVDILLANLPYIGRERFNFVADNVARFEPEMALYGGSNGLELYERMFEQINDKGWFPEMIAGEFGFGQMPLMENLLNEYFNAKEWKIVPDLAGIPRVFVVGSMANSLN